MFRSFYPLVEPYNTAQLTQDIAPDDVLFAVDNTTDGYLCPGNWGWLISLDNLRWNRVSNYLGSGVYETYRQIGQDFSEGDTVIKPTRHIFNTLPKSTQFGTVIKETMLKAAVISVVAEEEVWRHTPFVDSLTF